MEVNELLVPTILGGICILISIYGLAIAKDRKYALGGLFLYSLIPISHRMGIFLENPEDYFSLASIEVSNAKDEYKEDNIENGGLYINTFEEFDIDLQVGEIYLSLLNFDMSDFDLALGDDLTDLIFITEQLEQLLDLEMKKENLLL